MESGNRRELKEGGNDEKNTGRAGEERQNIFHSGGDIRCGGK